MAPLVLVARSDDVPEAVREVMTFHLVDDVSQVLELALESQDQAAAPAAA